MRNLRPIVFVELPGAIAGSFLACLTFVALLGVDAVVQSARVGLLASATPSAGYSPVRMGCGQVDPFSSFGCSLILALPTALIIGVQRRMSPFRVTTLR